MPEDPRCIPPQPAPPSAPSSSARFAIISLFFSLFLNPTSVFPQSLSPLPEELAAHDLELSPTTVPPPSPDQPLSKLLISQWTLDEGLPTNTLMNIHRSAEGYLWIAGYNGLVRFDGVHFEVFDKKTHPELTTNAFVEFFEDADGTLWLGTQGSGIWRFQNGRLEPFNTDYLGVVALSINRSLQHGFWLGMDTGLFQWKDGQFEAFELPGFGKTRVRAIEIEPDGTFWIASEGDGLARIQNGKTTWWTAQDGLASQATTGLLRLEGRLWISTMGGLSVFENDTIRSIEALDGMTVSRLYSDSFDQIWLASAAGLVRFDPLTESVELIQDLGGFSLRALAGIAFDNEGNVWLASTLSGLFQLRRAHFDTFTQADGLNTARVNTVFETKKGSLLLGLDDGTVQRLEAKHGQRRLVDYPMPKLPEVRIRNIHEDSKGRTWISSYAGLLKRENGRDQLLGVKDGLPSDQIRFTFEDSRGFLWIGTRNGGLVLERDDGFEVIGESQGLPSNFVLSLDEAPDGRLVAGLRGGMAILQVNPESRRIEIVATFTQKQGLPGAVVFNSFAEQDLIWMATDGGLALLAEGRIRHLGQSDGLPMDTVFDVKPDRQGNLWLTSSLGVIRMDRQSVFDYFAATDDDGGAEMAPKVELAVFDDLDGLSHRQCTAAAPFTRARNGHLMFPTLGGLSILDPSHISRNPVPPPIHIRSLEVDGLEARAADGADLELEPGGKRFLFRFSNLSLQQPQKNRVWFRLEGFDEQWIEAGASRQALYTNLSPGPYRFRVVGTNNDGVPNPQGDSLAFRLKPRIHETRLFVAALMVGLLFMIQRLFSWRVQIVRKRNAELEEIVGRQRRTDEENRRLIHELETKNHELERFTYTVSHDLKSPLVTIRGFAGALRGDIEAGKPEMVEQDIDLILKASKRMELLLGELLKLTRLGLIQDEPEWLSMNELAAEAVSLTAGHRLLTGAEIEIQEDMPQVYADRSRLIEVWQNLVENALKFVPTSRVPKVRIGHERIGGQSTFFVQDNGRGIPSRHRDQVFELFKRLQSGDEGTGVGLAVVKRTVEMHGGRIWVESHGDDQGTTFRFTLGRSGENGDPVADVLDRTKPVQ